MYDIVSFDIPKVGKSHIKPYCYISNSIWIHYWFLWICCIYTYI